MDTLRDDSLNSFINQIDLDNFQDDSFVEFISTTEAVVLTDEDFTETLASRDDSVLTNGRFTEEVLQLSATTRTTAEFAELLVDFDDSELSRRDDSYMSILPPLINDGRGGSNEEGGTAFEARRNENYQNVMKFQDFAIRVFDSGEVDGDRVSVFLNGGGPIVSNIPLTEAGTIVPISIGPGANRLSIVAASGGTTGDSEGLPSTTVGVEFVSLDSTNSPVFIGQSLFGANLFPGQAVSRSIGLPVITVDGTRSPYAAQHILDNPDPQILTVDRPGSEGRRDANRRAYRQRNGLTPASFDIDEAPPAVTEEGVGGRASTRPIPESDNRSAGNQVGIQQLNRYGGIEGGIKDGQSIDLRATAADYNDPNNIITPNLPDFVPIYAVNGTDRNGNPIGDAVIGEINEDNLIYSSEGNDVLRGAGNDEGSSADYILGDLGDDFIQGRSGDDWLLGQGGDDLIVGGAGDDLIYGGPGVDTLFGNLADGQPGGGGSDIFVLRRGEGTDLIPDFDFKADKIALVDGLKFEDILVEPIRGGAILGYVDAFIAAGSMTLGSGEPVNYPDFPGDLTTINFGARITDRSSGDTLAFLESTALEFLGAKENFIVQPGSSGRFSLNDIV